jgi:hypothetical protein
MHIVVIGGREKNEVELTQIATHRGYSIECHDGNVAGRGSASIRHAVARATLVVIVTEINSHSGVLTAKRQAQRSNKLTMVVSRLSSARLRGLLDAIDQRRARESLALASDQSLAESLGARAEGTTVLRSPVTLLQEPPREVAKLRALVR